MSDLIYPNGSMRDVYRWSDGRWHYVGSRPETPSEKWARFLLGIPAAPLVPLVVGLVFLMLSVSPPAAFAALVAMWDK